MVYSSFLLIVRCIWKLSNAPQASRTSSESNSSVALHHCGQTSITTVACGIVLEFVRGVQ
ncbi:MAG: hypothetical protein EZS28_039036, partial [Streblomastix strix]